MHTYRILDGVKAVGNYTDRAVVRSFFLKASYCVLIDIANQECMVRAESFTQIPSHGIAHNT